MPSQIASKAKTHLEPPQPPSSPSYLLFALTLFCSLLRFQVCGQSQSSPVSLQVQDVSTPSYSDIANQDLHCSHLNNVGFKCTRVQSTKRFASHVTNARPDHLITAVTKHPLTDANVEATNDFISPSVVTLYAIILYLLALVAVNRCANHVLFVFMWLLFAMSQPVQSQLMDTITCLSAYECSDIQCSGEHCLVQCQGADSCRGANITGDILEILEVQCLGTFSCAATTITATHTLNFTLTCSGKSSCQNGIINGPMKGDMSVLCSNTEGCHSASVLCPISGVCDIDCSSSGLGDCTNITVDATRTINGPLSFQSIYPSNSSTVYCPGNDNECTVYCGENGCSM
eukprot:306403_1